MYMLVKLVTFLPSVEMKSDRSCWNFQEPSGVRYCGLNTFCSCVNDGRGFANADTEKLKGLVILTALICKKKSVLSLRIWNKFSFAVTLNKILFLKSMFISRTPKLLYFGSVKWGFQSFSCCTFMLGLLYISFIRYFI